MRRGTTAAVTALLTAATLALPAATPGSASAAGSAGQARARHGQASATYTNPVSKGFADTYADPSVIRGKDGWWYAYATSDPLREGEGRRHLLPMSRSRDLVNWKYAGDAFSEARLPSWAAPDASLWAPDIRYVDGQYRLYYVVTQTTVTDEPNDNAIGVATAPTPTGPWTDSGAPVVGPRRGDSGNPGDFKWTFDPAQVNDVDGTPYLFYGSYYGGIHAVRLDASGTRAVGSATMVAIDNKFEGAYVVRRDGWFYLFASSADCCAGPTTGYSVQVGRSRNLLGPYVDRQGSSLTASRAGGTPTLYQNGNRWIGTGHNAVVADAAGQDWILYHAIDPSDPYLDGTEGINERPMLIDRLDWVQGWPTVRGGQGPSDTPQAAPVTSSTKAGPAAHRSRHHARQQHVGRLDTSASDEFNAATLRPGWQWVREPRGGISNGSYRWPTDAGDLNGPENQASVLLRDPPRGDWTIETKLTIDLGVNDVRNFQQGGLVAYVNDDLFTRLDHVAIWNTRQSEFAKEMPYAGRLQHGGTIVGPPAETTWLRITHRTDPSNGEHELSASTSRDGSSWVRGGTWTLPAGADLRIGLVSQGGQGATSQFDYFRTYRD